MTDETDPRQALKVSASPTVADLIEATDAANVRTSPCVDRTRGRRPSTQRVHADDRLVEGDVRVTNAAIDYLWDNGLLPIGRIVVVYGQTPSDPAT